MNGMPYSASLRKRLALIVILVSLTPLTLITGLMGYYFETSYRDKILENLHELLARHQQNINSYLGETLSDVKFLVNSSQYDELSKTGYLQNRLDILHNAYPGVFADMGTVNAAGVQIAYAGTLNLLGANYSNAEWFREAKDQQYFVSDVYMGLRREPHFVICIRNTQGRSEQFLRATVSFADFHALVTAIHVGQTGSVFIVNSKGELQSQPRINLIDNMPELLKITPWVSGKEVADAETSASHTEGLTLISLQKDAVTGTVKGQNGNVLFILMPLKSGEWTLVYQQQWDDAFLEISRARMVALTIFFTGCLAVLLAAFLISRKVVHRIEKAEIEKEKMNEQVTEAQKLASIGELAAGVAHEINNPVAIMVEQAGWMEDLLQEETLQKSRNVDEFKHALEQISRQGVRCKEITHKLLSYARKAEPVHRKVQLNKTLGEILSLGEAGSRFDGIQVHADLDRGLPPVLASPTEMQEVFTNLINNAIDAMTPSGGTLGIRSRVVGREVVVDISDSGHGMSKEIMARIFDPFFTTKSTGKGTGLGLSICYRIINNLGGKLTVDSTIGQGTTFHVHMPIPTERA